MVQTEQVNAQLIARAELQHVGDEHLHADGNVAHADKAFETGVAIDRLGDHARRVGEVNDPCVRADLLHIFHDVENHRDGAQPFKQPARPVGLLAKIAVAQRDALIFSRAFSWPTRSWVVTKSAPCSASRRFSVL